MSFGGSHHDCLAIDVLGYERSLPVGDYHDDNWLRVHITVAAGAFHGEFGAAFQVAELLGLGNELTDLHESLKGSATLETMEGQLVLRFEGNGLGAITLHGEAVDQPGIGNRLGFSLSIDQTQLARSLSELQDVLARFPIRDA